MDEISFHRFEFQINQLIVKEIILIYNACDSNLKYKKYE